VSGTELIVVTWLHEADRSVLQVHPMDDERVPLTGVFATRSSERPNPIGLHRVTAIGTDRPTSIHVDALLEAIDGTAIRSESCHDGGVRRLGSAASSGEARPKIDDIGTDGVGLGIDGSTRNQR
jgi:hypothetical protein